MEGETDKHQEVVLGGGAEKGKGPIGASECQVP